MGCPLSCPAKAIPHWWGPRPLVRATLVQPAPVLLPHQGGHGADPRQRLGPLGQLPRFRARSRSRLRAPGPPACNGQFFRSRWRSSWVWFDRRSNACLGVGWRTSAPRRVRRSLVPYWLRRSGDRLLSELSGGQLSGCCCPSVWCGLVRCWCSMRLRPLDATSAAQFPAAVLELRRPGGWTVLQYVAPTIWTGGDAAAISSVSERRLCLQWVARPCLIRRVWRALRNPTWCLTGIITSAAAALHD